MNSPSRTCSLAQLIALPYASPQAMQLVADAGCAVAAIRPLPSRPARSAAFLETNTKLQPQRVRAVGDDPIEAQLFGLSCDLKPGDARAPLVGCTAWTRCAVEAARWVLDVERA